MEALGRVVESVIGKAKQATVQVSTRGGVQPILSVESQLTAPRIRDLIDASTHKVLSGAIPDLKGGTALEVGEGPVSWAARLLSAQAQSVMGAEIGGGSVGSQGDASRGFVVRASVAKLPFPDKRFSYVMARLATQLQGDMVRALREISRVMAPGGQGVIVDYHPFGLYAKRGRWVRAVQAWSFGPRMNAIHDWVAGLSATFDYTSLERPAQGVSINPETGHMVIATIDGVDKPVKDGSWIVCDTIGHFDVLTDEYFRLLFKTADDVPEFAIPYDHHMLPKIIRMMFVESRAAGEPVEVQETLQLEHEEVLAWRLKKRGEVNGVAGLVSRK